jgi:hypothetical protein
MKRSGRWCRTAVVLALLGTTIPQQLIAAPIPTHSSAHARERASITDVALDAKGKLYGQVLSENGAAANDVTIHVLQNGREVTTATTNQEGQFEISGLRGGVYQFTTGESGITYRVWAPHTAPPAAHQVALLVDDHGLVRAQDWPILNFLSNPWVLGVGVAAAIAVPLSLDDDDAS